MKTLIYTVLFLLGGIYFVSCGDNDDANPDAGLDKFRAKEIQGHNELWGDFKIMLNYSKEILEQGIITGGNRDTIGTIQDGVVYMRVPALTQEEIDRLEPGSVVPMQSQIIFQIKRTTNQERMVYYKKSGLQFEYDTERNYIYEYDDTLSFNKKVLKWRYAGDVENGEAMGRMEYRYDGDRIMGGEYALYISGWRNAVNWKYEYQGERLLSVKAESVEGKMLLSRTFNYVDANRLSITTEENNTTSVINYYFNSDGYVTRIDEGEGNFMEIKYEAGRGDFGNFTSEVLKLQGIPYIR